MGSQLGEARSTFLEQCIDPRSIVFLAVKACSKGILDLCAGYGKSPWFSQVRFRRAVRVDCPVPVSFLADVSVFLECAF